MSFDEGRDGQPQLPLTPPPPTFNLTLNASTYSEADTPVPTGNAAVNHREESMVEGNIHIEKVDSSTERTCLGTGIEQVESPAYYRCC